MNEILIALVIEFSKKSYLREFEVLMYEQACRLLEVSFREARNEFEDYSV